MASITNETGGRRVVQFVGADGKRRSIRLGKMPKSAAESVRIRVEELATVRMARTSLSRETALWVAGLGSDLRNRLVAVGLVDAVQELGIAAWFDRYLKERTDLRPGTVAVITRTKNHLVARFGELRTLDSVSADAAASFSAWLRNDRKLAANTARRTVGIARQLWAAARKRGLATSDPFADIPAATGGNPDRQRMIPAEVIEKLIEACPCSEFRALLALARWGGLRVPSEPWALRWGDILWAERRFNVAEVKTARKTGRAYRTVPLFPEVERHLRQLFDEAPEGSEYVFDRLRGRSGARIAKTLSGLLRRCGIERWPKLFHNLRASRATELADRFPGHVGAAWLGHTAAIADRHYRQLTESHFAEAVQNPVQQASASERTGANTASDAQRKTPLPHAETGSCALVLVDADGLRRHEWAKEDSHPLSQAAESTGTYALRQTGAVQNPVQLDRKPAPESPLGKVLALVAALSDEDRRWLAEHLREE